MAELILAPYDRSSALTYAERWALKRNPAYYNFDLLGGDCTNFASQCLFAGSKIMDWTPTFGWFYASAENRTPSWTGVQYLYNFLTRKKPSPGPAAVETTLDHCEPGDLIQLSFDGKAYQHTPIIIEMKQPAMWKTTLVAAHTNDVYGRPLSTYAFEKIRFLHIIDVWK